jgi:uncharacterized membrane protein (DUF4010 family)
MREREANNRYRIELAGAMLFYIAVLFGSNTLAKAMPDGLARTLLLLSPTIPVMLAVWAIARHFRRMDEFVRLRSLEGLAIAAAVTAGLTFTYGFLEGAGFPKLSMFWVWGVMGGTWAVVTWTRCVCSR